MKHLLIILFFLSSIKLVAQESVVELIKQNEPEAYERVYASVAKNTGSSDFDEQLDAQLSAFAGAMIYLISDSTWEETTIFRIAINNRYITDYNSSQLSKIDLLPFTDSDRRTMLAAIILGLDQNWVGFISEAGISSYYELLKLD